MIHFKIRKAFSGKIILEQENALPTVYDNIPQLVADIFVHKIQQQFTGNELTVAAELIFNPPTTDDKQ